MVAYKELDTVESGLRDLKDVIEMRPVYHKTDERIRAHVFVATLALLVKRSLEHQLASALPELSSTEAFAAVKSIGIAELNVNDRTTRPSWTVTIATFDPPSSDYRRHRRHTGVLKFELYSVDLADTDGRGPSPA